MVWQAERLRGMNSVDMFDWGHVGNLGSGEVGYSFKVRWRRVPSLAGCGLSTR